MTFMALLRTISKHNLRVGLATVRQSAIAAQAAGVTYPDPHRSIVMVRMKNKVIQFPHPPPGQAELPSDEQVIIFTFGDQRVAVRYTVTEVNRKPAEVIPIPKTHARKGGNARRRQE